MAHMALSFRPPIPNGEACRRMVPMVLGSRRDLMSWLRVAGFAASLTVATGAVVVLPFLADVDGMQLLEQWQQPRIRAPIHDR